MDGHARGPIIHGAPGLPGVPPGAQGGGANLAPGLQSIIAACHKIYPTQKNPLQVTAVVKYWLGGPDPLDYISMFSHPGDGDGCEHWHYVSCGLSDLHGDARVHMPAQSPECPSGHGFELTFRLRREPGQTKPPTWPAGLMNSIAKYVFESENKLVPGDHVNWGKVLGGGPGILTHLLVTEDPELEPISTGLGRVRFMQLVGITGQELQAVQRWNGPGVIQLLSSGGSPTGGNLLVTDPGRPDLFSVVPGARSRVDQGIAKDGSNLCGIAAMVHWSESDNPSTLDQGGSRVVGGEGEALTNWDCLARQCDSLIDEEVAGTRVTFPKAVSLACSLDTARYLSLCIQGRLRHGYHFTLKSIVKDTAVTFVVSKVGGTLVSTEKPFAAQGDWLQVLIQDSFLDEFYNCVVDLENRIICLPHTFQWPDQRLTLTVLDNMTKEEKMGVD